MKKTENTTSIILGFFLFAIAAIFSIGLLTQLLGSGVSGSVEKSWIYKLGNMIYSVYGFCSICIPLFLLISGIFCFSEKWNRQRAICLLLSFIPFFTAAAAERLCRNVISYDEGPIAAVKIISISVIALLIIVAEYLIILVISGKTGNKDKHKIDMRNDEIVDNEDDVDTKADDDTETESNEENTSDDEIILDDQSNNKWTFKSMFSSENKLESDDNKEIDDAIDRSINEVTKPDWVLDDLLHNSTESKQEIVVQKPVNETQNTYGKFDGGVSTKVLPLDEDKNDNKNQERTLEQSADEILNALDSIDNSSKNVNRKIENETNDISDIESIINGLDEEPSVQNENEDLNDEPNVQNESSIDETNSNENITQEIDISSDPWNVTSKKNEDTKKNDEPKIVYLGKTIRQPKSEIQEIESQEPIAFEEDPAGLVEKPESSTLKEPETLLSEGFSDLLDDDIDKDIEVDEEQDDITTPEIVESEEENEPDKESFNNGSGIGEEPENPINEIKKSSMFSSLDSVFAKMDMDAKAEIEADGNNFNPIAPAVVDSNGQLKSSQIENQDSKKENTEIVQNVIPRAVPKKQKHGPYKIPTDLLTAYEDNPYWVIDEETKLAADNLKATLNEFKIEADVTGIRKGPVVTMFEILPAPGVKLSKVVALQDNIALRLAASSVRIVAPIPGKRAVGIEVPNKERAIVSFRECIEQDLPAWKKMSVPVVLGKDIQGESQIIDLVKTPHLLIAGSTGSGKSVCVNSLILSILYKRSPNDVKMILIDPKIVELKLYNDIPHLLTPVITEPKKAMQSLQYCLCEMERRYALLDGIGVRDISSYNQRIVERKICTEKLPYIVVIIDEFADLMATTGKELEGVVARLAAMSRAVGIHLVLATQRPSIDVITGLIKANIPSRIAFMVASKTDSRIIIDQVGAEKLLGKGDMLYASATDPFPVRIQGTFVSDKEVEDVVEMVKQWGEPDYIDDEIFVDDDEDSSEGQISLFSEGEDPLYEKALDIVVQAGKASASYIQRRLKIGYNRAARLVEEMEDRGIVGPANGSKPREIIHMP